MFDQLSLEERLVALYLLCGPQANRAGLYKLSIGRAAEDLHIPNARLRRVVPKVCRAFDWQFDEAANVVLITSWWRWNPASSVMDFKGFVSDVASVRAIPKQLLDTWAEQTKRHAPSATSRNVLAELLVHLRRQDGGAVGAPCDGPFLGASEGASEADRGTGEVRELVEVEGEAAATDTHMLTAGAASVPVSSFLKQEFRRFWEKYPRKVGKSRAFGVWLELNPGADIVEAIHGALTWQVRSVAWDDEQYIPYPATYLKDRRWEDEPE